MTEGQDVERWTAFQHSPDPCASVSFLVTPKLFPSWPPPPRVL